MSEILIGLWVDWRGRRLGRVGFCDYCSLELELDFYDVFALWILNVAVM